MDAENKIPEGYYIKARIIKNKAISHAPPHIREIWDYCLREANHSQTKYGKYTINRGQLFRSYKDIQDSLAWFIGWRKEVYNENQMKGAMKYLRDNQMITTRKQLGGVLITVLNYDFYNDPKNYETTNEPTIELTIEKTRKQPMVSDNNKNVKNDKKEEVIKDIPQNEFAGEDQEEFYLTKNKKKLKGKRLSSFLRFWIIFDYKKDKASAGDSWYDIPELTDALVNKICESAKREADQRQSKINNNQIPIYAQGWLTARRWEDEIQPLPKKEKSLTEIAAEMKGKKSFDIEITDFEEMN